MPINLKNLSDEELISLHRETSGKSNTYDNLIKYASKEYEVPEPILKSLVRTESAGDPSAVSKKGAQGLTQIMPATQKELGVTDPHDPAQSIFGGAKYLRKQYDQFGDWKLAAAAYNAGPGAVQKYGGVPPYPETQKYVKKVFGQSNQPKPKSLYAQNDDQRQEVQSRKLQDYSDQELLDLYKNYSSQEKKPSPKEPESQEISSLGSAATAIGHGLVKGINPFLDYGQDPETDKKWKEMSADEFVAKQTGRRVQDISPGQWGYGLETPEGRQKFKEQFLKNELEERIKTEQAIAKNPYLHGGSEILSAISPISAYGTVGKVGGSLGSVINRATKLGEVLPRLSKAVPLALEGAGVGAAYEAGSQEATPESILKSALIGAPTNLIGPILGAAVKKGTGVIGRYGEILSKQAKTGITREQIQALKEHGWNPLNFFSRGKRKAEERLFQGEEAARKAAFEVSEAKRLAAYKAEKEASEAALRELPSVDIASAGENLKTALNESKQKLSAEYEKLAEPVLKKYGDKVVSAQGLRTNINTVLKRQGLMDKKGNILVDELERVQSPQRKQMLSNLIDLSGRVRKNTTINELGRIKEDFGSIIKNFESLVSTPEQGVYKKIYKAAKDAFNEGLEKVSPVKEASALKRAKSLYAQKIPLFDELKGIFESSPESIIGGAKTKLPGTFLEKSLTTHPELREPLSNVVMNHLMQNATTPSSLTKRINYFGRPTLKKLFGDKQFEALEKAEKRFEMSKKAFEKGVFEERVMPEIKFSKPVERVIEKIKSFEGNKWARIDKKSGAEKQLPILNTRLLAPLLSQYLNLKNNYSE